jgi:MATE family multidrug resistance protein
MPAFPIPGRRSLSFSQTSSVPRGYRELFQLAGPIVLSRLGVMAMGLTDAVIVGRHSATELGFHSLGWAPTMTVLVAALGLLLGVQVMTARHLGAGQPERTGAVLRRGIAYALKIGLASTVVLAAAGPVVLRHLGLDPALAAGAARPLVVFSLSLTPYLVADCLWLWLEGHGRASVPTAAMWAANLLNLGLGLWLIPGNSPFPVEGAVAAAWVTLAARTALMLMLGIYVWRWPRARALGVFAPAPPDRALAAEQRRIGYASGLSYGIEAGSFASLNFVAAQLGATVVAGWALVMNLAAILFMVPLGVAAATGVLVARAAGARDPQGVRLAFGRGLRLTLATQALLTALVLAIPETLAAAYTHDTALRTAAAAALVRGCLFFVADGVQVVTGSALRARGDTWWPTGMHFISYALLMLPVAWWLAAANGLGLNGIVYAVAIASVISAAALSRRFARLGDRVSGV